MGPCLMLADDLQSNLPWNKVESNQPSIHGEMTFVQHDDICLYPIIQYKCQDLQN
jgi:hypothetical protein